MIGVSRLKINKQKLSLELPEITKASNFFPMLIGQSITLTKGLFITRINYLQITNVKASPTNVEKKLLAFLMPGNFK